jgi:hypothetical protein
MDEKTLVAASRRFPLLSRPRPECPTLAERVAQISQIAQSTRAGGTDVLAQATHALNKAALLVSDCGLISFARELCWQQINVFREAGPVLSVSEAGYMLAPVLNLARLDIRVGGGDGAVALMNTMLQAVRERVDMEIDGCVLPLATLIGTLDEHKKLHEWAWKACIADGVRALAAQGRWDEAVTHAARHRGIGRHLLEGRQTTIVAECLGGSAATAVKLLEDSTLTEPWEWQVASCLKVMSSYSAGAAVSTDVEVMVSAFVEQQPIPGYAPYRARLGMSVATLVAGVDPAAAKHVLDRTAQEALKSADGYAAHEVAGHTNATVHLDEADRQALRDLATSSGLGTGPLPEPVLDSLLTSVDLAAKALSSAICRHDAAELP